MQIEQQQPATVAAAQMLVSSAPEHLWRWRAPVSESEVVMLDPGQWEARTVLGPWSQVGPSGRDWVALPGLKVAMCRVCPRHQDQAVAGPGPVPAEWSAQSGLSVRVHLCQSRDTVPAS